LGVLSFVPLIFSGIAFALFIRTILKGFSELLTYDDQYPDLTNAFFADYIWIFIIISLCSILGLALMVTYIIFAVKDQSATENDKVLWVLLLVFFNFIAFPLYWYFRLWKNEDFQFEQNITDRSN
jgi:hypothetical protein